jgi:Fe2+ or Zn2+ uptake regulation protein
MAEGGDGLLLTRLSAALAELVRVTAPRRALLAQLASQPERSWTADELLAECNAACSGTISRPSVYRTLELLEAAGLAAPQAGTAIGHQRYGLTPYALAEIELVDPASGDCQRVPADAELLRALRRLCARHGLSLASFSVEAHGQFGRKSAHRPQR